MASFYGLGPAAGSLDEVHVLPGDTRTSVGHDPADLQPFVHDRRRVEVPAGGAEGVIVAEGDFLGGFSLFVQGDKLHYTYSFLGLEARYADLLADPAAGRVAIGYEFTPEEPGVLGTGPGAGSFVDGKPAGENRIEHGVPLRFSSYSGMDIGKDNGDPVSPATRPGPVPFTGKIGKVVFDINRRCRRDRGRSGGRRHGQVRETPARERHRREMDTALPPGSGGVIAVYDTEGAAVVDKALPTQSRNPCAIDGTARRNSKPDCGARPDGR